MFKFPYTHNICTCIYGYKDERFYICGFLDHYSTTGSFQKEVVKDNADPHITVSGSAKGKAGPEIKFQIYLGFVKVLEISGFLGLEFSASLPFSALSAGLLDVISSNGDTHSARDYLSNYGVALNAYDCVDLKISFVIEIGFSAGLLGFGYENDKNPGVFSVGKSAKIVDNELLHVHWHLASKEYGFDDKGNLNIVKDKDRLHKADNCPYTGISATFEYVDQDGVKHELTFDNLMEGSVVNAPEHLDIDENARFDGWFMDNDYAFPASFPYQMSDSSIVFYGKVTCTGGRARYGRKRHPSTA